MQGIFKEGCRAMGKRRIVTEYALRLCGTPYKWGGETPLDGFDCSGFAQECLRAVGLQPPRDMTSAELRTHFQSFTIAKPTKDSVVDIPPCALVFYGRTRITHVGVSIGHGLMVEAGGGTSKTNTLKDAIRDEAFVRIRPILRRNDLVAVVDPLRDIDPWCGV